jgi:hypothetical protein
MRVGIQFTGALSASGTRRWFTFNWPANWHVLWYVVPTSPRVGGPQIEWQVAVERASSTHITYWITVRNLTSNAVNIEGRYAVLN